MYVQMLDKYIKNIKNIKNIGYFRKYHDIFQPCFSHDSLENAAGIYAV